MKKIFEITLGIVTSIGGYLDAGTLATTAQAGALFGFRLMWVVVLGTVCTVFLVEMSGRLAAVSKHTLRDAMREQLGFSYFVLTTGTGVLIDLFVLSAEIAGVCLALQLATGIAFRWWAPVAALAIWLALWKGTFGILEKVVGILGLVTVAFVVGTLRMHPRPGAIARALLPSLPDHDASKYWFIAVSILGSIISPFLYSFYSAGAVEEQWDESDVPINRVIAGTGMTFGSVMALGVLAVAALVLHPAGIQLEKYEQAPLLLAVPLPRWGFTLFVVSLFIACFGAALEVALAVAYEMAQGLGWNWTEDARPRDAARFTLTYTVALALAMLPSLLGIDPLKVTILAMALTALTLPLVVVPFLVVMNDPHYLGDHVNGRLSNIVVVVTIALAFVLAVVSIPLQLVGG